jgi:cytochrome c553
VGGLKSIAVKTIAPVGFLLFLCGTVAVASGHGGVPKSMSWAYLHTTKGVALPAPPPDAVIRLPGSALELSGAQFNAMADDPDWFPDDHPAMPDVVARSRPAGGIACADCHLPNGLGHLGTAVLAGLPAPYLVEQLNAFRDDLRQSAEPRLHHTRKMNIVAKGLTMDNVIDAADYFSSLPRGPWVRVVETDRVPRTIIDPDNWLNRAPGGGLEPIGQRIVELAENEYRMSISDPTSGIIAYVPEGSIRRGDSLAHAGTPQRAACTTCHGLNFQGVGTVPAIAGQMPSYLARQLWDIKTGSRRGDSVAPMRDVVRSMTPGEIVAVAAYLASLRP